jgi:hypothetical protein
MSVPKYIASIWSEQITIEQIRNWRNFELNNTDWTQLEDSTVNKSVWATYRQALRDLPSQNADPQKLVFPTRPA